MKNKIDTKTKRRTNSLRSMIAKQTKYQITPKKFQLLRKILVYKKNKNRQHLRRKAYTKRKSQRNDNFFLHLNV